MLKSDEALSKRLLQAVYYTVAPESRVIWNFQFGFFLDGTFIKSPPDTCVGILPEKEFLMPANSTIGQMYFGANLNEGGGLIRFKIHNH